MRRVLLSSAAHKTTKILQKEKGRESTLPLVALAENSAREGEREFNGFGKEEAEEGCKVTWREKKIKKGEELQRGSLFWQRRGFCLDMISSFYYTKGTVQYSEVQHSTV